MYIAGQVLLAAIFLLCGLSTVFSLVSQRFEADVSALIFSWARRLVMIAAGLSLIAVLWLWVAFLSDDFSLVIVGENSDYSLAWYYKISALWAGSNGSFALWTTMVLVCLGVWLFHFKPQNSAYAVYSLAVGAAVGMAFSAILFFASNPFTTYPFAIRVGYGLNPLLQNIWMVIHPPLLFLGYSLLLVPFVVSLGIAFSGLAYDVRGYATIRRWLLAGLVFLSLGIFTGMRWSYVELGWGGFWAWDPVENASLLPWLASLAALHSLAGIRHCGRFHIASLVLSGIPFLCSLLATYVTRSGILASVHAYSPSSIGIIFLAFLGFLFLLWVLGIYSACQTPADNLCYGSVKQFLDIRQMLFWSCVLFMTSLGVIAVIMFWPVFSAHIVIEPQFYNHFAIFIGMLLVFLIGLNAIRSFREKRYMIGSLVCCIAAGTLTYLWVFRYFTSARVICIIGGMCGFAFVAIVIRSSLRLFNNPLPGSMLAHLGFILVVLAASLASVQQRVQGVLVQGGSLGIDSFTVTYEQFRYEQPGQIEQIGPILNVQHGNTAIELWPHYNIYSEKKRTSEVGIHTTISKDFYVIFDSLRESHNIVITAIIKPMMLWLWVGLGLIVLGFIRCLSQRKEMQQTVTATKGQKSISGIA